MRILACFMSVALWLSPQLGVAQSTPTAAPTTQEVSELVAEVIRAADVDGDGVSHRSEQYFAEWWLSQGGGSSLLLYTTALGQSAPYDLSAMFAAALPTTPLPSFAPPPVTNATLPIGAGVQGLPTGGQALLGDGGGGGGGTPILDVCGCDEDPFQPIGNDLTDQDFEVPGTHRDIQSAIDKAASDAVTFGLNTRIIVTPGMYQENLFIDVNCFRGRNLVIVSEQGAGPQQTTIDGNGAACLTIYETPGTGPTAGIYIGDLETLLMPGTCAAPDQSLWLGFSFRNGGPPIAYTPGALPPCVGSYTPTPQSYAYGGAVVVEGVTQYVEFIGNDIGGHAGVDRGAGFHIHECCSVTLTSNDIHENEHSFVLDPVGGGTVYVEDSAVLMRGNWIRSNSSLDHTQRNGMAVWATGSDTRLCDNQICDNEGHQGCGVMIDLTSAGVLLPNCGAPQDTPEGAWIEGNLIADNRLPQSGGGTTNAGGGVAVVAGGMNLGFRYLQVRRNVIQNNDIQAGPASLGGGLFTDVDYDAFEEVLSCAPLQFDALISGNMIVENKVRQSGGGVHLNWYSGGGLESHELWFVNNTVAGNDSLATASGLELAFEAGGLPGHALVNGINNIILENTISGSPNPPLEWIASCGGAGPPTPAPPWTFNQFLDIQPTCGGPTDSYDLFLGTANSQAPAFLQPTDIYSLTDNSGTPGPAETGDNSVTSFLQDFDWEDDARQLVFPTTTAGGTIDRGGDEYSPAEFRRGDVNLDTIVDVSDPTLILGHLFGGQPIGCADAADIDDNGSLQIGDANLLLSYVFGTGSAPPAPGPFNCGPDPTMDQLGCNVDCP